MNTTISQISQQKRALLAQIAETKGKIAASEERLRSLDKAQPVFSNQRPQYQLLSDICNSLGKLGEMGAANLFWARLPAGVDPEQKLREMRQAVAEFQQKHADMDQLRGELQAGIQEQSNVLRPLNIQLAKVREIEEKLRLEYIVVREASVQYRTVTMPWEHEGADEQRFRKILIGVLALAVVLGVLVSFWKLPPPDHDKEVVVPERLAQLVKKKKEKPPEPKPQEKKEEKKEEEKPQAKDETKPTPQETKQARAKAESKGVLAFKKNFAALMKDTSPVKLGADARISNSGSQAAGDAGQRSIITAQGGSGGINTSSLSRQGVGSGQSIGGVKVARVESVTGDMKETALSKGPGPSRTDEEIQIVFDRYKSALYRIYDRELRSNPSLRGKMVLRLTIEPDGHVSACSVKSTDLDSPTLSSDIVSRVLKFNFGPKEGAPAVTILYPIDFLPAT